MKHPSRVSSIIDLPDQGRVSRGALRPAVGIARHKGQGTRMTIMRGVMLSLLLAGAVHANPGDLDPTFGTGGIVRTSIGGSAELGRVVYQAA